MSRVKTEHCVINEGATGRIIARRGLRRGLGNPKKRNRALAELLQEMFFKGINQGRKIENLRITYATAGMEYGSAYEVAPDTQCSDAMSDGPLAYSPPVDDGAIDAAREFIGTAPARQPLL